MKEFSEFQKVCGEKSTQEDASCRKENGVEETE